MELLKITRELAVSNLLEILGCKGAYRHASHSCVHVSTLLEILAVKRCGSMWFCQTTRVSTLLEILDDVVDVLIEIAKPFAFQPFLRF